MDEETVLALVITFTVVWVVGLLIVEIKQIKDHKPVITTVLRNYLKKLPWPFILLALVSGFMMGHCFGN
jgi:hypothetical protein